MEKCLDLLPGRTRPAAVHFFRTFVSGMAVLRDPRKQAALAAYSVPVWLMEGAMYLLIAYSFNLDAYFTSTGSLILAALLLTAISNLATAIPSAVGGIGPFELGAQQTLVALGVGASVAGAYAGFVHLAALWLPVNVVGMVLLWKQNLSLRSLVTNWRQQGPDEGLESGGERPPRPADRGARAMRIGIIGGGVAGLAAAYELTKRGHFAEVFEQAPFLGGQASTFPVYGGQLERGYHHLFVSDTAITELIHELGLGEKLAWLESKVGLYHAGKVWDFSTPTDLLRFTPLSLLQRLRVGLWTLLLQRTSDWRKFEDVTRPRMAQQTHGPAGLPGHLGAAASRQIRRILRPG